MSSSSAPTVDINALRYAALLEIADLLSCEREPASLFRNLDPLLRRVVAYDFIHFGIHDPVNQEMHAFLWDGNTWPTEPECLPLSGSSLGWLWQHQASLLIGDVEQQVPFEAEQSALRASGVRGLCGFPLIIGDGRLGAILFASRRPAAFSSDDLQFLNRVAELIALSVHGGLSESAVIKAHTRAHILLEAETLLASTLDLQQLLRAIAQSLRNAIPHDWASLAYYDDSKGRLRHYWLETPPTEHFDRGTWITGDDSILARSFQSQEINLLCGEDLCGVATASQPEVNPGACSACLIPLSTAKTRVGVLKLESGRDRAFTPQHVAMLSQIASIVALALENALTHRSLRLQRERMQTLLAISTALASGWDLHRVFPKISSSLRRIFRHEYASVALLHPSRGKLVGEVIDFPLGKGILREDTLEFDIAECPAGKAVTSRAVLIISHREFDAYSPSLASMLIDEGIKSLCCVPLCLPGGPLGTLNLASTREGAFQPDDCNLLRQVGMQIAIAFQNSLYARQIEDATSRLHEEQRYLEDEIRSNINFDEIVGHSAALKKVLDDVATVASSDSNVLVLGETGTGKELIARAIHRLSRRKDRTFIKLNCAAIPTGLLESELFGHEKGAFTGAVSQKIGRMELADQGTLFLDEVGEIPLELQPKLLRLLQDREFEAWAVRGRSKSTSA